MLKRDKIIMYGGLTILLVTLNILMYFLSTPRHAHTLDEYNDMVRMGEVMTIDEKENLAQDFLKSFNENPESPIVCYRKNHRNFYVIIFSLVIILLGLSFYFLLKFRSLNKRIQDKNEELKAKNEELRTVYGELNSSLDYAHNIHRVILPYDELKVNLPNSFAFHDSCKQIGGDFFWCSKHAETTVVAVIDCTGHGVPGALLSMISFNLLKQVITEANAQDPKGILTLLNERFIAVFNQSKNKMNDGLDISLCAINHAEKRIVFAGAGNPIYYTHGGQLEIVKGSRVGIGGYANIDNTFENHEIPYDTTSTYYLFSDGYADQFGGEQGKKLGSKRMKELIESIADLNMEHKQEKIENYFNQWCGSNQQNDDVTVVGFNVK